MTTRTTVYVSGRVQGVGFRFFTARIGRQLGLRGTVANLPDGRVRVVAEGPAAAVTELIDALHTGPSGASVQTVRTAPETSTAVLPPFTISP